MSSIRTLAVNAVTVVAHANAANLTDNQYMLAIKGGTSSQLIKLKEVFIGGQEASASKPVIMVLAPDSTVAATPGGGTDTQDRADVTVATAPATLPVVGNAFTTKPQRGATRFAVLPFNGYGGVVRWNAAAGEEPMLYGSAVDVGEASLSAFTGTTSCAVGGHLKYEVF